MGRVMRSCIQSLLKLVNSVIGMIGLAMILYSVWMIRVWERQTGDSPFSDSDNPAPWFIYSFLGLGASLSVITCLGHITAETANGCCLYLYMLIILLLLMLEGVISADVFLNHEWEEDFPKDPSGFFDEFKNFLKSNFEICKWVGLPAVSVQVLSLLFAVILKALGPHPSYDSDDDDDYDLVTAPLLKNAVRPPPYATGGPVYGNRSDAWSVRINEKLNR